MKHAVHLVVDAEYDLLDIFTYAARHDSRVKAARLLDNLETAIMKLEAFPLRGHCPPELERIGVYDFREVFYKPYRIIYQVVQKDVYVHCVLDGRRDLRDILQQRILR